jgi:hypothetical protein
VSKLAITLDVTYMLVVNIGALAVGPSVRIIGATNHSRELGSWR